MTPEPGPQQQHSGEVGIEIAPLLAAGSPDADLADRIDGLLRRTCKLARALTGAEQSALKLWVGEDPTKARKYFSLIGHRYGLLQLSDRSAGRDFDASDEENVRELAALIGETLDALGRGVREAG